MVKKYVLQWKKGITRRYYIIGTGFEIQIGKYRGPDGFDKEVGNKPIWHNKWYVDDMQSKPKLFRTKVEAEKYLVALRNKIFKTKQLN